MWIEAVLPWSRYFKTGWSRLSTTPSPHLSQRFTPLSWAWACHSSAAERCVWYNESYNIPVWRVVNLDGGILGPLLRVVGPWQRLLPVLRLSCQTSIRWHSLLRNRTASLNLYPNPSHPKDRLSSRQTLASQTTKMTTMSFFGGTLWLNWISQWTKSLHCMRM